ncbi:UDP-glucuronosyl and UDP-glucosyl transferase [Handroanthus impetiginosus]|uniref:UDP-glucuronosyl and UDP-glucosyl transferase n=1 Tax=Handroanthus impetiginosus TaxID=429701 RepID=A0A2G9FXK2_9LAMI|nr:UDP-glucuronosyl and UDP-glucosyl transferase [Handroanthus impetiginosus]
MAFSSETPKKPHAVFVPFPTQGHINPLLKLAKLLHHRGFHITFVNTEFNHNRLLKSKSSSFLENLPDFRFETIPDGLPPEDANSRQDLVVLNDSTRKNCLVPFRELLKKLNDCQGSLVPPVSCVITDGVMSFTLQASQELNIPNVLFWTFGACGFLGLKLLADLTNKGIAPFKDSNYLTDGTLDTPVDWLPGLKNFQLRHIPTFIRTTDPNDLMLDIVKGEVEATSKASAIILHTFHDLEREVLNIISPFFPPIYSIGPLELLVNQISDKKLESINCSLWKQEPESIKWLDSKEQNSVLYVNFGSIAVMTENDILELAMGLKQSEKNFLWVIRPNMVKGKAAILPLDFVDEIKDRGLIVGWCPQEKVLNHPSVGGFFTHCGWNSTIEGISAGVPFVCLPCLSEQPTNSKFICDEWGIGMEIGGLKRCDIGRVVRELMEGEEGKKMKKRAMEWKEKAMEAASGPCGSSFVNVDKLVKEVLLVEKDGK